MVTNTRTVAGSTKKWRKKVPSKGVSGGGEGEEHSFGTEKNWGSEPGARCDTLNETLRLISKGSGTTQRKVKCRFKEPGGQGGNSRPTKVNRTQTRWGTRSNPVFKRAIVDNQCRKKTHEVSMGRNVSGYNAYDRRAIIGGTLTFRRRSSWY